MVYTLEQRIAKGDPKSIAISKGELMYMPNKPCPRGHLTLRYTKYGQCLDCLRIIKKEARASGKYKAVEEAYQKSYGKKQKAKARAFVYGLSTEQVEELKRLQNFKCAICKDDFDPNSEKFTHVDHCHSSGEIRGILCRRCNVGMGNFKDNVDIMQNAINYILKHKSKNEGIIKINKPAGKRGWISKCKNCYKSYRIKLKNHEQIKTDEEIEKHKSQFVCDDCSKIIANNGGWTTKFLK